MKRATKLAITLGTALTLGLGAMAASGHPDDGYGQGYGMGHGMMGGYGPGNRMGPGMMSGYSQCDSDEGLDALKADLGITDKQEAAWQAFAKNAQQQNESRQAGFAKMQQAQSAGSAPELLAQQAEIMKQRLAEIQVNAAALKSLYATLTPDQKLIADQHFGGFGPLGYHGTRGGAMGYGR